jgi:molecular chaperone DnaK (HSP70)
VGETVGKAVITVPAYFSDAQRQATREAGEIAGLEVVRIINEPTAAALAYESCHSGARKALVYDLGGGTFDVSVVNLESDVVEVLASHGNNHLGGDDFDQKLVDFAIAHLQQKHDIDATRHPLAMARLQRAAEAAKITLSDQPYATLSEEYLLEKDGVPIHLSVEISRARIREMIEPYIAETLEAVHVALSGAGLTVADINEILLVGGATRTPLVQRRLERGTRHAAARRSRSRSLRRHGRRHPGGRDRRRPGADRARRCDALHLRYQRPRILQWRNVSLLLRAADPQEHADSRSPGARASAPFSMVRARSTSTSTRARTRTR